MHSLQLLVNVTFNNVNNKFCVANNFSILYNMYKYNHNVPFANLNFHAQQQIHKHLSIFGTKKRFKIDDKH